MKFDPDRNVWSLGVLLLTMLSAGCSGNALTLNAKQSTTDASATKPLTGSLTVTGSSTIAPLANVVAKRFEEQHPDVRIDVQSGGSSRGVADARGGLADIGMVSRVLKESEKDLTPHLIARDGICVIVHDTNSVTELKTEQIIAIYKGEIRDWKVVGGPEGMIVVVNKAQGRSTLELFCEHFQLKPADIRADVVIGDNEQGIKTVAGNPLAIGYVSVGSVEQNRQLNVPVKGLSLNGIEATTAAVAEGTFPIARELNLVTKAEPSPLASEFIRFAKSSAVHDLVKELGFVPVE